MDIARRSSARFRAATRANDCRRWWRAGGALVALGWLLGAPGAAHAQRPAATVTNAALSSEVAPGAGDYLLEQLRERDFVARRWPERVAQPIRLWMQPLPTGCACAAAFPAMVRSALAEWEAVGVPVRFAEVSDSGAAEVHVMWSERLAHDESGRAVWWSTPQGWITRARITIRTRTEGGTLESPRTVRAVALHEIGHVLGLAHVAHGPHVMSAWVDVAELSEADRRTAVLLYRLPAGRVSPAALAALFRSTPDGAGPVGREERSSAEWAP